MYIVFDLDKDFFQVNIGVKLFFKEFLDQMKQKKASTEEISKKMWCVALYNHEGKESPFYDQTNDERAKLIKLNGYDVLKEKNKVVWSRDNAADIALGNIWKDMTMTKYQKLLKMWYDKEEERTTFVNSIPYTADNWEMLDKIRAATHKIWQDFEKIQKMVTQEMEEQTMGGQEESFLESLKY